MAAHTCVVSNDRCLIQSQVFDPPHMPLEHDAGLQLDESQETSAQPRSRPDAAHSVVHEWDATLAALSPVIGRLGVAALYDRSVRLSSLRFGWLAELGAASQAPVDLELLRAVLVRQSNEQVLACAAMLRQSFNDLLTSLVGASLTERLLSSVEILEGGGESAQDTRA